MGAEEVVPFLWEELGKFPECGKGESQKEMRTCPTKTTNCKKEQKATHQTSEVLKRVHLEPQGQNFAPFRAYSGWKH